MKYIFIIPFVLFLISVNAQKNTQNFNYSNIPLSEVLIDLETFFDVKFSYKVAALKNKNISLQMDTVVLEDVLSEIEKELKLFFKKIDSRYYVIKTRKHKTICGYLKDGITGAPVEGASITNDFKVKGIASDKFGFFSLQILIESNTLSISHIGYKPLLLLIEDTKNKKCDTYILTSENYALNEVVLQEYLASGIVMTSDRAIKIIPNNMDALAGLSEPDILQNIQLLPGIESPLETASGLHIRGGAPDQNLILWDGIKMYSSTHFFGMISAFNPYITKDVKVYKSGTDPKYGDRISGVIDINTDNKVPLKIQGGLGVNMTHGDVYLKTPVSKKIGILVSARKSLPFSSSKLDNYANNIFQNTSIIENQNIENSGITEDTKELCFSDITLKGIFDVSAKDKITIASILTKNKFNYTLEQGYTFPSKVLEKTNFSNDNLNIKNFGANLSWNRQWNNKFTSKTNFYSLKYNLDYLVERLFLNQLWKLSKSNNINEFGFSILTDLKINDAITFSNGYDFFSNRVDYILKSDYSESDNTTSSTHAIYNQIRYDASKVWRFDIGIRTNYHTALDLIHFEPRIYVERKFGDYFRLKGSAEIKGQTIRQVVEFDAFDNSIKNHIWVLAQKDNIPLLKSNQFSGGFLFSKNGWNIDIDAYFKSINGITSITRGFESNNGFFVGSSQIKGIDFLFKKKVNNYSAWIAYTNSKTSFILDDFGDRQRVRGNNDITHSLTWSQFYTWKNFQFSLGWKYRTGLPYTKAMDIDNENYQVIDFSVINGETLPSYHRLDFSAIYTFKLVKNAQFLTARLGFSLLNVYDRKNVLSRKYQLYEEVDADDNGNLKSREINTYSLGITPNIFFRLNF